MVTGAEREIRRRIAHSGRITFREFMELSLYWPDGGYYTSHSASADYYTAPAAHPAFGSLLCLQLYQMWSLLDCPPTFWVIEPGARNGLLADDITRFARNLPSEFRRALRYVCLDRHPWREGPGSKAVGYRHDWLAALGLPLRPTVGVVLSNELLDAFPVHRVRMEGEQLQEIYVTVKDGRLVEALGAPSTIGLQQRLRMVGASLMEGWETEVNLAMDVWVEQVAGCLERGFVVTVDYGKPAAELVSAERARGTLTTFRDHVQTDSPLRDVGRQDITSQVDFTALQMVGNEEGLECRGRTSQGQFLRNMGIGRWLSSPAGVSSEADAERMGMRQLIRPGGMGDFQVMFQAKGVAAAELWGLSPSPEAAVLMDGLDAPKLTARHAQLLGASYPHLAQSFEYLWPGSETP